MLTTILRWSSTLPAAIFGYFLGGIAAYISIGMLVNLDGIYTDKSSVLLLLNIAFWITRSFFQVVLSMFFVAKCAPKYKSISALVTGAILILVQGLTLSSFSLEAIISLVSTTFMACFLSYLYIKNGDSYNPFTHKD